LAAGLCPDLLGGFSCCFSAPPEPIAAKRGPTSKGGDGKGVGGEGRGGEGKGGEGGREGRRPPRVG